MFSQYLAALSTTEHRVRQLLLEGGALWAVTYKNKAQALLWVSLLQCLKARPQQAKVLFHRQPADMQHGDIVRPKPPAFA
ncbi:hypothetical protein D3C81_1994750 [compost metagenome]